MWLARDMTAALRHIQPFTLLKRGTQRAHVRPIASAMTAADATDGSFRTLAEKHSCETEVKKSKFIAIGWPIASTAQAMQLVNEASDLAASHNCFAYKLGSEFRSSDDGEPGGTAGRPILGSIEGEGLDHVCVLVTRYFGGIKLGAGGLARAYGGAARDMLRQAEKAVIVPHDEVDIQAPFGHIGAVYQIAEQQNAERISEDYGESGEVVLRVRVERSALEGLKSALLNATSGQVTVKPAER